MSTNLQMLVDIWILNIPEQPFFIIHFSFFYCTVFLLNKFVNLQLSCFRKADLLNFIRNIRSIFGNEIIKIKREPLNFHRNHRRRRRKNEHFVWGRECWNAPCRFHSGMSDGHAKSPQLKLKFRMFVDWVSNWSAGVQADLAKAAETVEILLHFDSLQLTKESWSSDKTVMRRVTTAPIPINLFIKALNFQYPFVLLIVWMSMAKRRGYRSWTLRSVKFTSDKTRIKTLSRKWTRNFLRSWIFGLYFWNQITVKSNLLLCLSRIQKPTSKTYTIPKKLGNTCKYVFSQNSINKSKQSSSRIPSKSSGGHWKCLHALFSRVDAMSPF